MWPPFYFRWSVAESGYRWEDASGAEPGDRYLELADLEGMRRLYEPFEEEPTLFLKLAEVDPTEPGILEFANKYGNLSPVRTGGFRWKVGMDEKEDIFTGHTLKAWQKEIRSIRDAVEVWQLAKAGDLDGLSELIHWNQDVVYYQKGTPPHRGVQIAAPDYQPDVREMWERGQSIGPAYGYLQLVTNDRLEKCVSPKALWDNGKLRMTLQPASLADAIWIQLFQAYTAEGDTEYRRCKQCGTWFEISKGRARKTREYCGDTCRVQAYRSRKKEKERQK